jgi:hypothetical protein
MGLLMFMVNPAAATGSKRKKAADDRARRNESPSHEAAAPAELCGGSLHADERRALRDSGCMGRSFFHDCRALRHDVWWWVTVLSQAGGHPERGKRLISDDRKSTSFQVYTGE